MTRVVTLGTLLLDAARGDQPQQTIPVAQMHELGQNIMQRAVQEIDNIREEQRKAHEEGRASVLRKRRGL